MANHSLGLVRNENPAAEHRAAGMQLLTSKPATKVWAKDSNEQACPFQSDALMSPTLLLAPKNERAPSNGPSYFSVRLPGSGGLIPIMTERRPFRRAGAWSND